jgi:hypothetical protein
MSRARSPFAALPIMVLLAAGVARADVTPDAEAERLVKEGHELLERGQVAEACDKFDLSLKRADTVNTLALLAFCHEREGKPGRAWNEFKRVEPKAPTGDKAVFVAQHLRALEAKVGRARLDVGSRTITEVRVDNEVVLLDQGRIVADPGDHTVRVDAGGHVLTRNATFKVGDNPTIMMTESPVPTPAQSDADTPPPRRPASDDGSGARIAGWVVIGVGVALVAVGVVEGLNTFGLKSDADALCAGPPTKCKDDASTNAAESKRRLAVTASWVSNIGFGLGAVGLGIGIYLVATAGGSAPAPARSGVVRVTPVLGPGAVGLAGSF